MLTHCINPDCHVALRSFSEGRLFQFEVVSISVAACDEARLPFDEKPKRQTSHFWLCGRCASDFYVTLEPSQGIQVIRLQCDESEPQETPAILQQPSSPTALNHC
jgi:hypothetical protein